MKRKWLGLALAAAMACAGAATQSTADVLAEDSAANYTDETFVSGANLGSGFHAWEFWNAAPTLADSTAGLCGDINSENGVSFRFARDEIDGDPHWGYCNGYRGFDALNPGDVLTFRFTCAYCAGNRGLDLFANGGHSDEDKIANVINLSGDNEYSVNGVVIANNWAPHAVSEVTVTQLSDGIEIAIKRTSTEEGVDVLEYSTKVETSAKLTGIGLYAGGWDWNGGADVENYAFYVNDLKIEGIPPADKLSLDGYWAVTKASDELAFKVSRTKTEGDLAVALASSYPEFASVPESVTIADGETEAAFTVTATLQGNANAATITASAEGIASAEYGIHGPEYTCNAWDEGVEEPWNVDVGDTRTLWINNSNTPEGFPGDDSLVTVESTDESVVTADDPAAWAIGDDGKAYTSCAVAGIGGGKATVKVLYDGVEVTSYDFTVPEAGATLSGPTSIRVGVPTTYTLDVTLPSGMTDSLGLEAEGTAKVVIEPDTARELEASGTLDFTVTAVGPGTVTLTPFDTEGLSFNELVVTVSEAPDYDDYIAYDDASLYDVGDLNYASVGEGTEKFLPWDEVYKNADGESTFAGAVVVTAAPDASALTEGQAFALYANGADGAEIQLRRQFANALSDGQAFSVVVSPNYRDGTKGLKFMGVWEGEWYPRAEFFYNNDGYFYKLDGDENATSLEWDYGTDAITVTLKKAADGSSYTLSFARGDDIVVKEGITSFAGTVDAVQFYSWQGGTGDENNLVFNSLAIEQVEEPVPPAPPAVTMSWTAGVWNPDEVGVPYTFTLEPSEIGAIGPVDLSIEPADGVELSADQIDLSEGAASFTLTFTGEELPAGTAYTITAKAQAEGVDDASYGLTATAPYSELRTTSGEYTFDYAVGGTIEFQIVGTPSRAGQTVALDSGNEAILVPPSPAEVVVGAIGSDDGKFVYTMVGEAEGEVWVHATKDEAEWGYAGITINGQGGSEPRIDGTTIEVSFADGDGLSGKVDDTLRDQFTNVKAQVLQWNGVDAFTEVEVLENEAEWPDMQFTPSIDNPVIRLIFVK